MPRPSETLKLGLVTDLGRIDDGTFNQYAYDGLVQAASEHGLEYEVIETESRNDYERNLQSLIERGCTLIVTIGSTLGPAAERLATRYTSVHFVIVDYEPLPDSRNVTGLVFAEDEAGFLAGALAGLMTDEDVVGFVGGMDIPPVLRFQKGFENGVAHTNKRAKALSIYTDSFTDTAAGEEAARELIGQGADVIFAAAGASGSAAIRAAAQAGAWVIGVDQDEWVTTFQNGAVPGAERLITSAVKRVDHAVYTAIDQAVHGHLRAGVQRFDLSNDGVGLAPYHAADAAVPSEVKGKILEVRDGL
ncbi:MAG TPA: BMP family ABC transporter substrate-binding protein, partial [Chloroflexi bacterium]|nr:BMP family ABC transporter substrate-binding protein [Chloroflexota bacterium]